MALPATLASSRWKSPEARISARRARRAALAEQFRLAFELQPEPGDVGTCDPLCGGNGDGRLDQPARIEHLARLFRRRIGDEGAAIAFAAHQPLEGQHLQRRAHHGAAHREQFAHFGFAELGARREAPVDDRVAQLLANAHGAVFTGQGWSERKVGDLHGVSHAAIDTRNSPGRK